MPSLNPIKIQTTYSFQDLVGALVSPAGTYQLTGGNAGFGQVTVSMKTERADLEESSDGTQMPVYKAGAGGTITMEIQQTSSLHHYLLGVYNTVATAADAGEISSWAALSITLRTVLDGSQHIATGVMFQKVPDKSYAAKGGNVTWTFICANIVNS